jgi:uncharacterized Zn-binding protein involved in type VI secretion
MRFGRVLSVLMLIAVVNVFVFANGTMTANSKSLLGRLITTSNRPVLVNGGEAVTGSVIVSGAELATSASGQAIVQFGNMGSVTVAPSSFVSLNFDSKSILVKVMAGNASVAAADGVTGTVVDANGKTVVPGVPVAPAGGSSAKNWGIAGVAIGSAGLIWGIIGWNKAGNAEDDAKAAQASAATLASQLAALRTCLAGQTTSPVKLCTSF